MLTDVVTLLRACEKLPHKSQETKSSTRTKASISRLPAHVYEQGDPARYGDPKWLVLHRLVENLQGLGKRRVIAHSGGSRVHATNLAPSLEGS